MRVIVKAIISRREYGSIFAGIVDDERHPRHGKSIKIRATNSVMIGGPERDEIWNVDGDFELTPWGEQLQATRAVRQLPSGSLMRDFLTRRVAGIGPERAQRLWARYGTELSDALIEENFLELAHVIEPTRPTLGLPLAVNLVTVWQEIASEVVLIEWFNALDINEFWVVRRILDIFGADAVGRLSENPWILVPLLPWKKVDKIGLAIIEANGFSKPFEHPDRLIGACDAICKDFLRRGDTAIDRKLLAKKLHEKIAVSASDCRIERVIALGVDASALVPTTTKVDVFRAPGAMFMENFVLERLTAMHARQPRFSPAEIDEHLSTSSRSGLSLHTEQRDAIAKIFRCRLSLLQGGAGVGKTHVTRAICEVWEAFGGNVRLLALAGKASLRLSKAAGRRSYTIARLIRELDERKKISDTLASSTAVETDRAKLFERLQILAPAIESKCLVVVDEASMVDLATIYRLLCHMPDDGQLLLVGDEAQLPPVGFGLIFHRLVVDDTIAARLTVIHRQTDVTGIPTIAKSIRNGLLPKIQTYIGVGQGVSILETDDFDLGQHVQTVANELGGFDDGELLIIAPTKREKNSVAEINQIFHVACHSIGDRPVLVGPLGTSFSLGEPVIYGRNDYSRGLFNGSIGRVAAIDIEKQRMSVNFDGEIQHFEVAELLDVDLAYAITCHKAQGSQAKRVIVVLKSSKLLDPSWIYTAITRAEEQVVLIGPQSVLAAAMSVMPAAARRRVGFEWLPSPRT
jgi:exodeoxyribonuclease V alpha subunit